MTPVSKLVMSCGYLERQSLSSVILRMTLLEGIVSTALAVM